MNKTIWIALAALTTLAWGAAAHDHPDTLYELPAMSPQNMDYDAEEKMFKAHPGWVNGKLVHYYKFRMYTPSMYPGVITAPPDPSQVPLQTLYLLTTDLNDAWGGYLNEGILSNSHFTATGEVDLAYSDFNKVVWVEVAADAAPTSADELAGMSMVETDIVVNLPVVPMGSWLEDPASPGQPAPISGWTVTWNGQAVQTFVFETTDQAFADHFNAATRVGSAGDAGSGYEVVVTSYATPERGNVLPIWHVNQFFTGVEPGVTSGGPAHMGQRNVISHDRLDPGYSPLWQVWWINQVPPGYELNEASEPSDFTAANGFGTFKSPMFVNCPNIGVHGGGAANPMDRDDFEATATLDEGESITLEGALVMQADQPVTAKVGDTVVATATSGMMGAFQLDIDHATLPNAGTNLIEVEAPAGMPVPITFTVDKMVEESMPPADDDGDSKGSPVGLLVGLAAIGGSLLVARRARQA